MFLDDLVMPAGDERPASASLPLKSILKVEPPSATAHFGAWASDDAPCSPDFWHTGTIVQLPAASPQLEQFVAGALKVLQDAAFARKFEVYAALNHVCKSNDGDTLHRLMAPRGPGKAPRIELLCSVVRRDLEALESNEADPFGTRIINQALKLVAFILADPELNSHVAVDHARWFYQHACEMTVKPTMLKTLVLLYLVILKDCRLAPKRKRQVFDTPADIPEQMLFALLNLKGFQSSSLVVERFVALKNLIVNFPHMMAKNIGHWLPVLVVNLCDLGSPLFAKTISMGVQTLLETAKTYIDNKNVLFTVKRFLASNLPHEVKLLSSEVDIVPSSQFDSMESSDGVPAFDYVTSSLEEIIRLGQYKTAMDMWVALTLLTGSGEYETWPYLARWLKVHKLCFNQVSNAAKTIALASWKAIIYNVCHNDLDNLKGHHDTILLKGAGQLTPAPEGAALTDVLKPKIKLLLHPLLNVTAVDSQRDIIDVLHSLFLSMVYSLLHSGTGTKYAHIYWDTIVQPVLASFYFKRGSSAYMNELGVAVFSRIIKGGDATSNYNALRCLSNEPTLVHDISPLPAKWVFAKFDRVAQSLMLILKHDTHTDIKMQALAAFLKTLKVVTKKEIKPSACTADIIGFLPSILDVLLTSSLTADHYHQLIALLVDTFGPTNLIGREDADATRSVFYLIARQISYADDAVRLLALLSALVGEKLSIFLIRDLVSLDFEAGPGSDKENESPAAKPAIRLNLQQIYQPMMNKCRVNKNAIQELRACSVIFQTIDHGFETMSKKLIQDLVLCNADDFQRLLGVLNVSKWTMPVFNFFVALMHDAPHHHLKQLTLNTILAKWEVDPQSFAPTLEYLVESRFDFEVFNLKKSIMRRWAAITNDRRGALDTLWRLYMAAIQASGNFALLDELLVISVDVGFDVKPFVRNQWDRLPLLKRDWLTTHTHLYIDPSLPERTAASDDDCEVALESLSPLRTLPPSETKPSVTEEPAEPSQTQDAATSRIAKTQTRVSARRAAKNPPAPPCTADFDIHSFTAMLTAKLSPSAQKKPRPKSAAKIGQSDPRLEPNPSVSNNSSGSRIQDDVLEADLSVISESHELEVTSFETPAPLEQELPFDEEFDYASFIKEKSPELNGTMSADQALPPSQASPDNAKADNVVKDVSVQPKATLPHCVAQLASFTDAELRQLSPAERGHMETQLLEFMLRLKYLER